MNIKQRIRESGHRQWEVAEVMGINEFALSRHLRRPEKIDPKLEARIEDALIELKKQQENQGEA